MTKRIIGLVVFIMLVNAPAALARDDFQVWSQLMLKPYKGKKVDFVIFADARYLRDAEKLGLYFISPRLIYHYSKNLDLGINYTYLQSRKVNPEAVDDSFNGQDRLEFEVNPQWALADWVTLKMRNRVELRWIEDKGSDHTRYRQRWMFVFPFKNAGPLKSAYINSEFFYDLDRDDYVENRSVPVGLNFKITEKLGFSLFYMIQSQKGTKDWSSNQILGTLLSVDF